MNKKRLFLVVGLSLVFAMMTLLVSQGSVDAQKCRIIRIHQEKGSALWADILYVEHRVDDELDDLLLKKIGIARAGHPLN